jgi:alkyl hydroperoxide reductase subunit AhpC
VSSRFTYFFQPIIALDLTVTFGSPKSEVSLVPSFTLADVHGEVCPASWTPGAKTMKADPVGSQEYFKSVSP